jgi:hypothetical protein
MYDLAYEDECFCCHLQYEQGVVVFHSVVKRQMRLSDIKRGRAVFKGICERVLAEGYDKLFAATPSPHFARLMSSGLISLEEKEIDGIRMEIIVWELKQRSSPL